MSSPGEPTSFLTIGEAATLLRVSTKTIQRWCQANRIPHTRVGRTIRLRREDLAARVEPPPARPALPPLAVAPGRARILAVANIKGGVAKTTTTFALGEALAARGQRVLLVDIDPQAGLTEAAGHSVVVGDGRRTIYDALMHYNTQRVPLRLASYRIALGERLDLLPACLELADAEDTFQAAKRREYLLTGALRPAEAEYDVVLIDCPPSIGLLQTNALTTAHGVLVPVALEYLAVRGLSLIFRKIEEVRRTDLNPTLVLLGTILTRVDGRTTHNRTMDQLVATVEGVPVLGRIKSSIHVSEAAQVGQSVWRYLAGTEIASAYTEIADALLADWAARPMGGAPPAAPTTR